MSQENVDVVRTIYDAFARGDFDGALDHFHEEVTWIEPPGVVAEAEVRHGHEGVRQSIRQWVGTWDDYRFELGELVDCGDRVLDGGRQHGRGKGSGIEISDDLFHVWTLRGGKVIRQQMFRDRREALEAAGLRE